MEYNDKANDEIFKFSDIFLDKCYDLGAGAEATQDHGEGFGTEEATKDFLESYNKEITTLIESLEKVKEEAKKHYPNLCTVFLVNKMQSL